MFCPRSCVLHNARIMVAENISTCCNLPEDRYRVCCSEEELQEMCEDSTDIFKRNMLDRHMYRPDVKFVGGKYSIPDRFCYAKFLSHYVLVSGKTVNEGNDSQPEILNNENMLEVNHNLCGYPLTIPLMSSKEKLKCKNGEISFKIPCPKSSQKA